jgi:NADPH2:quinone reductase
VLLVANRYQVTVPPPFVPGSEFAGVVVEVGADVQDLPCGTAVFGAMLHGAFATEIVVPRATLRTVPAGVDLDVVAAFAVAHPTAYHVLRSVARLREDETLVVLGAGGGVGLATVEVGAVLGAHVVAVASTDEKVDVAREKGAALGVVHSGGDLRAELKRVVPDGADVVVDPVGGELAEPALRALRWNGRFVSVGYASGVIPRIPLNLVLLKGVAVLGFQSGAFVEHEPDQAARNDEELLALLADGRVRPHIGARFALDDVADALRYVADGRAIGKVGLDVRTGRRAPTS